MKKNAFIFFLLLFVSLTLYPAENQTVGQVDWENHHLQEINRLPARAAFMPYQESPGDRSLSLNGQWKFQWVARPDACPQDFYREDYDDSAWTDFPVPANWEVNGYGTPIYISAGYPFRIQPPFVVDRTGGNSGKVRTTDREPNPVGSYRRRFSLPSSWENKEIFLRFDGVMSAFYVWINGRLVGYSQGSMEASEFDVTPYLSASSENLIAIRVYKYSDGSYLEDQDMWRFGGIQRDVTLCATEKVSISDVGVRTDLDAAYENATLLIEPAMAVYDRASESSCLIRAQLYDAEGQAVFEKALEQDAVSVLNKDFKSGILNARTPQRGARSFGRMKAEVKNPHLWTAETPYLYRLELSLCDTLNNRILERISINIGFREVAIANGQLLVNGKPVRFRGVNRHEHDPQLAKVMTEEMMLKDIQLMKRANVNAVRTSHYPNVSRWYELCDEYGIYVMDEADIESHGVRGYLASNPDWAAAFMDRTVRMAMRDRNYPSVICWSLGNESGFGFNFAATAAWLKDFDPTRFIHYEGAQGDPKDPSSVDVIARFYPRTQDEYVSPNIPEGQAKERYENARWERLLSMAMDSLDNRPVMTSEYAHAMGNAMGNFKEYWDEIYSHPRMLGGFIWDWVDQGLYKTLPDGRRMVAYGGDFGDTPNSKAFCMNGVILCDRSLTPKYEEVRKVYQPLKLERMGESLDFRIENRHHHVGLEAYRLLWTVTCEDKIIEKGEILLPGIPAGTKAEVSVPASKWRKCQGNVQLKLSLVLKEATLWAESGYEVAWEQFTLHSADLKASALKTTGGNAPKMTLTKDGNILSVSGKNFSQSWNTATAALLSYRYRGKELLATLPDLPTQPYFQAFRAPTDNDAGFGNWLAKDWKNNRMDAPERKVLSFDTQILDNGNIEMRYETECLYLKGSIRTVSICVLADNGRMEVRQAFFPEGDLPVLPRLGVAWTFSEDLQWLAWYGYGPQETYPDRKDGASLGLWSSTVDQQLFPYPKPQESGNHEAVQWLSLKDGQGRGLTIKALDETFSFSALPYVASDLATAKHHVELMPRPAVICSLDAAQLGLGNSSCGPGVLKKYLVKKTLLHYILIPE